MITVDTLSSADIRLKFWREYFDAGPGPNVLEGNGSSPTPPVPALALAQRDNDYILDRAGDYIETRV
jgi:hypothetical protein